MLLGLFVACTYHATLAAIGFGYPWDTFLFNPADRFNDWHNSVSAATTMDPYYAERRAVSTYFPFAYLVLQVGGDLPRDASTAIYVAVSLGLLFLSVTLAGRYMLREGVEAKGVTRRDLTLLVLICFLAYPVLFALDRGNLDIWIAAMCVTYVATLRTRLALLGAFALACAIAMKGYPIVFLGLAVAERRYAVVAACVAIVSILSIVSLRQMSGSFAYNVHGLLINMRMFHELYVLGPNSLFGSSDPYNGIRAATLIAASHRLEFAESGIPIGEVLRSSGAILRVYSLLAWCFALIGAFFVLAVPAPRWRRVLAVCLLALLFPNVANDYKLTILLPGLLMLLLGCDSSVRARTALALLGLLMVPKSYVFFSGMSVSMLVNPLLLIALCACVLGERAAWRRGFRLLRFRVRWLASGLHLTTWRKARRAGVDVRFKLKEHKSMHLD